MRRFLERRLGRVRREPHYESVLRPKLGMRPIAILLAIGAATWAVLFVIGRIDTIRRSGSVPAALVSVRFVAADPYPQQPAGSRIEYTYTVGGSTYSGSDFRTWIDVPAHHPRSASSPPTRAIISSLTGGSGAESTLVLRGPQRGDGAAGSALGGLTCDY